MTRSHMNGKWMCPARHRRAVSRSGMCHLLAGIAAVLAWLTVAPPAYAQARVTPSQQQEQHQRAQQQARERQRRRQQPDVRLQKALSTDYRTHALPSESSCFTLQYMELDGSHLDAFSLLSDYLDGYLGRCVGPRGLNLVVRRATRLILAHGYVTTRLLVPQQDLSTGKLRLLLVPGVVGRIRYAPGSMHVSWRNALPLRSGDLLNLRAIEQGLEQMKRVPSQDVHINIAPGSKPGVSDLVLDVQRSGFWRGSVSYSDAGSEYTGKQQGSIHLAVDQPAGINDILSVGLSGYVGGDSGKGFQSNRLRYSVPWDYWTFALSSSGYSYHRHVHGASRTFETGGRSRTTALSIKRVVDRSESAVTSMRLTLSGRTAHSNIEDVEIRVQRRHTTAVELALLQRRYIGRAQLDLSLAQRRGVPWFGAQSDAPAASGDAPTFSYTIDTFDAQLSWPFRWGRQALSWSSTLHAQYTRDRLYAENFITLGGRYTIRGFDGRYTLGAERGWFWRNRLGWALGNSGMRLYGGIDVGHVGGADARTWSSHTLAGAFLGLRGTAYGLYWNVFAGWAIEAPDELTTRRPAAGMQVVYQF